MKGRNFSVLFVIFFEKLSSLFFNLPSIALRPFIPIKNIIKSPATRLVPEISPTYNGFRPPVTKVIIVAENENTPKAENPPKNEIKKRSR